MRYKDICKWIKKQAEVLPEEAYFAREYYYESPKEDDGVPKFANEKGRVFEVGQYLVNHSRRIKHIWQRTKDFNEIQKYFLKYGYQLNYAP